MSEEKDMWVLANNFVKEILPEDLKEKLVAFAKKENLNENEFRLFRYMIKDAIDLEALLVQLKNYNN
jgi:hypothetical protein